MVLSQYWLVRNAPPRRRMDVGVAPSVWVVYVFMSDAETGGTMVKLDCHPSGRHFLQIPGPSPVPDRILRAMSLPTIDHRGPEFGALGCKVLAGMQTIFKTRHPVIIYPASG